MEIFNLLIAEAAVPSINFIGKFIDILVKAVGSVGVAVIIFTLILKAIVLPLDIVSRVSMKKNAIKMERLKPQIEKLQKQYANNRQMLNQKMSELYKKERYSMFGACLPMIASLVFFIVVLIAFQNYAKFKVAITYNTVAKAYNAEYARVYNDLNDEHYEDFYSGKYTEIYQTRYDYWLAQAENPESPNYKEDGEERVIFAAENAVRDVETAAKSLVYELANAPAIDAAQTVAKVVNSEQRDSFLWIKNVWVSDVYHKNAVPTYSEFESLTGEKMDNLEYSLITGKMEKQGNGFYIMTVLCVLVTFSSQLVMKKTQKGQPQMQGQNSMGMQKMMLFIMPILMGVFSFSYSGAFSVYIVTSSLTSTISNLLINILVEKHMKKKFAEEEEQKDKRRTYLK